MTLPNFIVIGAARSGTTSLYRYLEQHPEIYVSPIKETNFFAYDGKVRSGRATGARYRDLFPVKTLREYQHLFRGVTKEHAIGEASPRYLHTRNTPHRIRNQIPSVKLIAVLRDPVCRAYSSYLLNHYRGWERRAFEDAVKEEIRGRLAWSKSGPNRYLEHGLYHQHLARYLGLFDRSQVSIHLYEDLVADAATLLREIFAFLKVDTGFVPDTSKRYNASTLPSNRALNFVLRPRGVTLAVKRHFPTQLLQPVYNCLENLRSRVPVRSKPRLSPEIRRKLVPLYREDILQLQRLLERDLSQWLH